MQTASAYRHMKANIVLYGALFANLHAYPLTTLDHDVSTITGSTAAIIPHSELDIIADTMPELTRKLWFSTLLDAAIHRA